MKRKTHILLVLIFGVVIGWALGFLRLPHLANNCSFWVGFFTALTSTSLVLLLIYIWNSSLFGIKSCAHIFYKRVLVIVFIIGIIVIFLFIYNKFNKFIFQSQYQTKKIQEMSMLLESMTKQSNLAPLMKGILNDVWKELRHSPGRALGDTTIARIAALSLSFKPYRYFEADTLSGNEYSPERGQLLQALVLMDIDSGSFAQIKKNASFAGADLREADLKGRDLSGVNLKGANLKGVDMSGANLKKATLIGANLWGANLNQANLSQADMKRADMQWAQLNEAVLTKVNLKSSNLANAQLKKAKLNEIIAESAKAEGALLLGANFTKSNLVAVDFTRANLDQAILDYSDIRRICLSKSSIVEISLKKSVVDKDWIDKLNKWQPTGAEDLLNRYKIANDTFNKWNDPLYRLEERD
ncbi:MAG TPA: pentapeptide repeat-containing protein [Saprospiraceae bacterium]|nr:pentapeptide repeat-containing protein [Saprospiraceae bacterium]